MSGLIAAMARNNDPITSKMAATAVHANAHAYEVLTAFSLAPDLTDEEAAIATGFPRYGGTTRGLDVQKRCSDLRRAGYIRPTGETRKGSTGHLQMVSAITDAGRKALAVAA